MPSSCTVGGCGISFFTFPKEKLRNKKWAQFVKGTRPNDLGLINTRSGVICSKHFKDEYFANILQFKMGFMRRAILKPTAVPTIGPSASEVKKLYENYQMYQLQNSELDDLDETIDVESFEGKKDASTQCDFHNLGSINSNATFRSEGTQYEPPGMIEETLQENKRSRKRTLSHESDDAETSQNKRIKIIVAMDHCDVDDVANKDVDDVVDLHDDDYHPSDEEDHDDEEDHNAVNPPPHTDLPLPQITCENLHDIVDVVDESVLRNLNPDSNEGWFLTAEGAKEAIKAYDEANSAKFANTHFHTTKKDFWACSVRWSVAAGFAYIIITSERFVSKKAKGMSHPLQSQKTKREHVLQNYKVLIFPKVVQTTAYKREKARKQLQEDLRTNNPKLVKKIAYLVRFPPKNANFDQTFDLASFPLTTNDFNICENSPDDGTQNGDTLEKCRNENVNWLPSMDKVKQAVEDFEISTFTRFIVKENRTYGDTAHCKVRWDDNFTPYIILRTLKFECHHAKDRQKKFNDRRKSKSTETRKLARWCASTTKKTDCKAIISVWVVRKFPQFKLSRDSKTKAHRVSLTIHRALKQNDENLKSVISCRVEYPKEEDHSGHAMGEEAGDLLYIDERLIVRMRELVEDGKLSVNEMKTELESYVVNELFEGRQPPPRSNRRYFPDKTSIRNNMSRKGSVRKTGVFDIDS